MVCFGVERICCVLMVCFDGVERMCCVLMVCFDGVELMCGVLLVLSGCAVF